MSNKIDLSEFIKRDKKKHISHSVDIPKLYQPIIYAVITKGKAFKQKFVQQYVPNIVFESEEEAAAFLPIFAKSLIRSKDIRAEDLENENLIKTAVQQVTVGQLEDIDQSGLSQVPISEIG